MSDTEGITVTTEVEYNWVKVGAYLAECTNEDQADMLIGLALALRNCVPNTEMQLEYIAETVLSRDDTLDYERSALAWLLEGILTRIAAQE